MKGTTTLVMIIGILVLGFLGYYFYTSYNDMAMSEDDNYEMVPVEETSGFDDINEYDQNELEVEAEIDTLENMDF